jgi:DNA-3-methyladenine glycosylase II
MTMHRYRVAQDSMLPNLRPGEEFVATTSRPAGLGDIAAFPHPERQDFWIVKRVAGLGDIEAMALDVPTVLEPGQAWLISDNPISEARDSNSFGAVRADLLRPLVTRLDETTFGEAVDLLAAEDKSLREALATHGRPLFWSRRQGFATLVLLVLEQQVSLESGAAVFRRLVSALGEVTPERILEAEDDLIRSAGTTRQKTTYIRGLAEAVSSGELDLDGLNHLPLDAAMESLTSIRGIGPWTAEAYLLSAVSHPDIFPVGDRALQVGTAQVLQLDVVPKPDELEVLSEPWRPVRSAAARIIWHAYLTSRGRTEPVHDLDFTREVG